MTMLDASAQKLERGKKSDHSKQGFSGTRISHKSRSPMFTSRQPHSCHAHTFAPDDKWHHMVATYCGASDCSPMASKLYVDGVLIGQDSAPGGTADFFSNRLHKIGATFEGNTTVLSFTGTVRRARHTPPLSLYKPQQQEHREREVNTTKVGCAKDVATPRSCHNPACIQT